MDYSSLLNIGKRKLIFSVPSWITPPSITAGSNNDVPLTDVNIAIESAVFDWNTRKYAVVINVTEKKKMVPIESSIASTAPLVRTVGGYVKQSSANVPLQFSVITNKELAEGVAEEYEKAFNKVTGGRTISTPSGVVVAVPIVLGVIAGLLGIGLIYLTLDKVEEITSSPSVSLFVIAVAGAIIFTLFKQIKASA
jgi:hypothetical protein